MTRRICMILTAMLVLMLAVTACGDTASDTSAEASTASEGETTYTGTVIEIGLDHLVLSTDDGEVTISYSEETEFVGFNTGGGMMDAMGGPGGDMGGFGESSFDEITSDTEDSETAGSETDEAPEDVTPDSETMDAPEDMPEMPGDMELPDDLEEPGDMDMGDGGADMPQDSGDMAQSTSTYEDVSLNDVVTVVVGADGVAVSVTLNTDSETDGNASSTASSTQDYDAANEYTSDTEVSGEDLTSMGTDENAVLVATEGITVSLDDVTISRLSEDSTGGDNSSFYGVGASALVTDGILSILNSTIISDAAGGAGVFAYGSGIAYVSNTTITTEQDTSGGIHVAGGGTLYAWDLTVETQGESSAAIRSDRGSGTIVVDGGSYTSNGVGSPAVYSTADITINNADLTANGSEAICIEGRNTIRLFDCTLSGNMSDLDQNDCTWNVILYQSLSGDSEEGNSTFEMIGGTLTAENGGMFYTTNTESTFILSGVEITNAQDSEFLLKCTGNSNDRGWGTTGENGADCNFTAIDQVLEGDVIWDSISQLDFYLTEGSTLTGALVQDETAAGDGGDGYANLYIDEDSTWIVTGDSTLTALSNAGTIVDEDGNLVSIVGTDGTVYVSGSSAYTITVESYAEEVDLSGASTLDSWDDFAVDPL